MRVLTAQETAALAKQPLTLAVCWKVTDTFGNLTYHTTHDREISVDKDGIEGLYVPTKPLTVSEVSGGIDGGATTSEVTIPLDDLDLTRNLVRAGVLKQVRYTLFVTDWEAPANVGIVLRTGTVGNVRLIREDVIQVETRGLKQFLNQPLLEAVSRTCRADLGDSRCMVNLAPLTANGTVTTVGSRRQFLASGISEVPDYFSGGVLEWQTGDNTGFSVEVRTYTTPTGVLLFEPTPFDIDIGDTFTITPGCDKVLATCRDKFNNVPNFQGEPFAPDATALINESSFGEGDASGSGGGDGSSGNPRRI